MLYDEWSGPRVRVRIVAGTAFHSLHDYLSGRVHPARTKRGTGFKPVPHGDRHRQSTGREPGDTRYEPPDDYRRSYQCGIISPDLSRSR